MSKTVATSLLAAGGAKVVLLRRWSGLYRYPVQRPCVAHGTTLDQDYCFLEICEPRWDITKVYEPRWLFLVCELRWDLRKSSWTYNDIYYFENAQDSWQRYIDIFPAACFRMRLSFLPPALKKTHSNHSAEVKLHSRRTAPTNEQRHGSAERHERFFFFALFKDSHKYVSFGKIFKK